MQESTDPCVNSDDGSAVLLCSVALKSKESGDVGFGGLELNAVWD